MTTRADAKARLAHSNDSVPDPMQALPPILLDTAAPRPSGWAVWRIGVAGPAVAAPDLSPLGPVPEAFARRYFERLVATARGTCHRCGALASVDLDPQSTPASWALLEVGVSLVHTPGCPLTFGDDDRPYLDARAFVPPTSQERP